METYVTPTGRIRALNSTPADIRVFGEDGSIIFHAIELRDNSYTWHGSAPDFSGVIIYPRQNLITEIANRIRKGAIRIHIGTVELWLDDMGNTWYGPTYLAPNEYLPLLIPE